MTSNDRFPAPWHDALRVSSIAMALLSAAAGAARARAQAEIHIDATRELDRIRLAGARDVGVTAPQASRRTAPS